MEETKWLTKGKIILFSIILLIIGGIVTFVIVHKNNLKKDYIKFESQLEYAAPNYLLKEKISLKENEWREIDIKDILKQKLVINKRSADCEGYVIAEGLENEKDTENKSETQTDEEKLEISNNVVYNAYITCKNIYKTKGYGTRPTDGDENDETTQTENDTIKPTIELFGDKEITLTVGDTYTELGAIAMDNVDGDITSKIKITGKVNTEIAGTYTIKYTVSDSSKNKISIERTIIVKEKEVEEPVTPEIPSTNENNNNSGNNNNSSNNSNNNNSNNTNNNTPVYEKDVTEPIITFNDSSLYQTICTGNSVNIATNGPYGYVARDNVDGNITGRVSITGDTGVINTPGTYNLYYSVSDSAGNTAHATRQFTVNKCSSAIPNTSKVISVSSVRCTSMSLTVGAQKSLIVSIYPEDATNKQVTYESSNTKVATVSSNGVVVANSKGTATITVISSNNKKGTCSVTVR